jgi:hypothetical protein
LSGALPGANTNSSPGAVSARCRTGSASAGVRGLVLTSRLPPCASARALACAAMRATVFGASRKRRVGPPTISAVQGRGRLAARSLCAAGESLASGGSGLKGMRGRKTFAAAM